MYKLWKLLTTSLILALNLASPQVIHSMDAEPAKGELKLDSQLLAINSFFESENCPLEMKTHIIVHAAIEGCKSNISPIKFLLLSKELQHFFQNSTMEGKPTMQILQEARAGPYNSDR